MLFKATAVATALALLLANQAIASPIAAEVTDAPGADLGGDFHILTSTNPYYACNCPNNCSHKSGSSCKYYAGPSDSSSVIKGKCANKNGRLTCIAK